jgi:hypothetical protein
VSFWNFGIRNGKLRLTKSSVVGHFDFLWDCPQKGRKKCSRKDARTQRLKIIPLFFASLSLRENNIFKIACFNLYCFQTDPLPNPPAFGNPKKVASKLFVPNLVPGFVPGFAKFLTSKKLVRTLFVACSYVVRKFFVRVRRFFVPASYPSRYMFGRHRSSVEEGTTKSRINRNQ